MAKILFLFHGMGVHGADWSTPVIDKLNEVAARYSAFQNGSKKLGEQVTFVPITYDGVFRNMLERWNESSTALNDYISQNGIPVKNFAGWLSGVSETESNFFWSHVVDVLLYRFFDTVKREVRTRVLNDIVATLTREMQDGAIVEASVLAHSLGTSVSHDCLAYLGDNTIGGSEAFKTGNFRFVNIFMLANVGRVLETNPTVYQSVVKPRSADPNRGYCSRFYNFRHKYDPIPAVSAFKPEGWGEDFRHEGGLEHIHEFNVHDYLHYLDHPAVHIPIIRGLLGPVISEEERKHAIATYPPIDTEKKCPAKVEEFRKQLLRNIALIEESKDPMTLIKAGVQLYAAAEEAYHACK